MRRTGLFVGTLGVALLLLVSLGSVTAQTDVPTRIELSPSPPSPPWTADPDGEETLVPTNVRLCWQPNGLNPSEGSIKITITPPANTDLWTISPGPTDLTKRLPQESITETEEWACESAGDVDFTFTVGSFEEAFSQDFTFTATGVAEGDIGTFSEPDDVTAPMTIELEPDVDPLANNNDTDDETETEDDDPPEAEDSPAPGVVLFVGFAAALVSLLRRRR